ncbi:MAG TPA: hypothetical protein VKG66_07625 [Steroidobacteraceae bacterium]|nr:hypothetical protein [Steroidobacteraceae bacterium]
MAPPAFPPAVRLAGAVSAATAPPAAAANPKNPDAISDLRKKSMVNPPEVWRLGGTANSMSDYIGWFGSVALFLVSGQVRSIRASVRGCNRGTERVVGALHHALPQASG